MKMNKNPKQIYKKLFKTYNIVIFGIVVILIVGFLTSIRQQIKDTNIDYIEMLCDESAASIKKLSDTADLILRELYNSNETMKDLINYFSCDLEEYLSIRLNNYSESNLMSYQGIDDFAFRYIDVDASISKISFLSYEKEELTEYKKGAVVRRHSNNQELVKQLLNNQVAAVGELVFMKEIKNPNTQQSIGCMSVSYSTDQFISLVNGYKESELLVTDANGNIVFSSAPIKKIEELFDSDSRIIQTMKAEKYLKSYVSLQSIENYTILSYVRKENALHIPLYLWLLVVIGGSFLMCVGEYFVHLHLRRLTKRLKNILNGMELVTKGDLTVRLDTGQEEDELDIISQYFNKMCSELDTYIQKSYLAEIEQKNAELDALQSQINPHFLYNTLESIRMKAICNGDREVGKMLYGLAVLFRSQIKEKDIITIAQELHYCKKYLELFEFRYQEKFQFEVNCSEQWMRRKVIKFIVQPVIENYFVHGIRMSDTDNFIRIDVKEEAGDMIIEVSDNGTGMEQEEIEQKNAELKMKKDTKGSIGILNVQRRLQAAYGNQYGITLKQNVPSGLKVTFRFPSEEEKENV